MPVFALQTQTSRLPQLQKRLPKGTLLLEEREAFLQKIEST